MANPRIIIFLILFFFLSCKKKEKFNKEKWNEVTDPGFPPSCRSVMLEDLITNYKLVGLKYSQLIELLGNPKIKDSNHFLYEIVVDYGYNIDPVYLQYLYFTFTKDSIITSYKVEEWEE